MVQSINDVSGGRGGEFGSVGGASSSHLAGMLVLREGETLLPTASGEKQRCILDPRPPQRHGETTKI